MPGHEFEATVTRISGAEDSTSRTLQVELQVPNSHGEIFAGSYAQVRFHESADANVLNVTDNALIFRAQGMQVAVVGPDNRAQLRSIKLGRDFGATVEVLGGLNATDRVILNPPDSIADGMPVRLATTTTNTVP
jgi:multidrug efflux pump subunit AcrA (membrane-fusion protein)